MRKLFVPVMLFAIILAACAGSGQAGSLEAHDIADLETRLATLESQVADLNAAPEEEHAEEAVAPAFGVAVAQYVMDTAGFHAMDETLGAGEAIDPAYLSTVTRVRKVTAQAPWPEDLQAQADGFLAKLDEFAAALEADDAAAAAPLAAELHEVQHDFSHAVDNWLGGEEGEHGHGD